jgi:ribosomal protein S18 acetylase RimI-like enzyme
MSTAPIEIRRATPEDWRVVKSVRLAALTEAPYAFGSTYQRERGRVAAQWRDWIGSEATRDKEGIWLAMRGTEQVGIVGAFHETKTSVMLIAMWVAPEARRTGTGRRLTRTVVEWAAEVGARRVTLWVADDNPEAIGLYRTTGFKPTGKSRPLSSAPHRQISEYARRPK